MAGALRSKQLNASRATGRKTFRMILNTSFSSPQAWLLLAQDRGFLDQAGIELELTPGEGAYTSPDRMSAEGFDLGFGDINALVEVAARSPKTAPIGILMMFGASPAAIAVNSDGPIRMPSDLVGKTIIGHDTDVALRTFGAFCLGAGVNAASVTTRAMPGSLPDLIDAMMNSDRIDGVFGYPSTIQSTLEASGGTSAAKLRFMPYADHVTVLYGSCLMASPQMLEDEAASLAVIVDAFSQGLREMVQDPSAAIAAVARRRPGISHGAELLRLQITLGLEMAAIARAGCPEAVDMRRLACSIDLLAESLDLPTVPSVDRVFDNRFSCA